MDVFSIERETRRQCAPQPTQTFDGLPPALVARHFELTIPRHPNLDLIAFLECQCFDHGGGKPHGEAVPPLRDLHVPLLLGWIYSLHCISCLAGVVPHALDQARAFTSAETPESG